MKRFVTYTMAMVFTLALSGAAWADNIVYEGFQERGLNIKITTDDGTKTVASGEFNISWDEGDSLSAFCVDLLTAGVGGTYDVTSLDMLNPDDYEYLYQAAWIMDNYAPGLNDAGVPGVSDKAVATAVQLALWNLTTDTGTFSFQFTSGTGKDKSDALSLYTSLLDEVEDVDFSSYAFQHDFSLAQSDKKQDLLIATEKTGETPEPGTMLLLGSALGIFAWRRKKRA